MCTENLRWRRGREAGPGDISSITLRWKEKATSWTWSVFSCVLMECSQTHRMALHVCWLLHSLESCPTPSQMPSNSKLRWLTSGAEIPVTSLPGDQWGELGTLLKQHGFLILRTWGITHFLQHPRRPLTLTFPLQLHPSRMGCPCNRESNVKHSVGKRMLKAMYWDHFSSLLQMSSLVWLCPLLLIPTRVPMPEFGWLSLFVFLSMLDLVQYLVLLLHASLRKVRLCVYY